MSAMALGEAFVTLSVKDAGFQNALGGAAGIAEKTTTAIQAAWNKIGFNTITKGIESAASAMRTIGGIGAGVFGGLAALVKTTVAQFDPVRAELFSRAMNDLSAVVGQMLAPVLDKATVLVRQFADYLYNMSPETKKAIAGWAEFALKIGAVGVGLVAGGGAITAVTTTVSALGAVVTAVGWPVIALGGALGGLYVWLNKTEAAGSLMDTTWGMLKGTWNSVSATALKMWDAIQPGLDSLKTTASMGLEIINQDFQILAKAVGMVGDSFAGDAFTGALQLAANAFNYIAKSIENVVTGIFQAQAAFSLIKEYVGNFKSLEIGGAEFQKQLAEKFADIEAWKKKLAAPADDGGGGDFEPERDSTGLGMHKASSYGGIEDLHKTFQQSLLEGSAKPDPNLDEAKKHTDIAERQLGVLNVLAAKSSGLS